MHARIQYEVRHAEMERKGHFAANRMPINQSSHITSLAGKWWW